MGMIATCSLYLYFVQFLDAPKAERRLLRFLRRFVIIMECIILLSNYVSGSVVRYNTSGYFVMGPLYDTASYILPFYFIIIIIILIHM